MKPHILRISESNNPQKLVECLQEGILIRFNEISRQTEDGTIYQCSEFWFDLTQTTQEIEEIVTSKGFILTQDHKNLIQ